ncbi:hypothetical protein B0H12DRAFT_1243441 [Mycena haematopus]|nr:hypothetical protein B0H12DRAFT_1243441 [Mycena haematopus]
MTRALSVLCALLFIAGIGVNAETPLVIGTPSNVTQCGMTNVTWSGGLPPYTVFFNSLDATMPAGGDLAAGTFNTSILWSVAEPAGQGLFLSVFDFGDSFATSGRFVVQPSDDASCLASSG